MEIKDICDALFSQLEKDRLASSELIQGYGITIEELHALVEFGIIDPEGGEPSSWSFSYNCISVVKKASHLKRDFELSPLGIALVLLYQKRIHELEDHIKTLECYLLK